MTEQDEDDFLQYGASAGWVKGHTSTRAKVGFK